MIPRVICLSGWLTEWKHRWALRDEAGKLVLENGAVRLFDRLDDIERWAKTRDDVAGIEWPEFIRPF